MNFPGEATIPLREIREVNSKKEIKVIEEIKQQAPKVNSYFERKQFENNILETRQNLHYIMYREGIEANDHQSEKG